MGRAWERAALGRWRNSPETARRPTRRWKLNSCSKNLRPAALSAATRSHSEASEGHCPSPRRSRRRAAKTDQRRRNRRPSDVPALFRVPKRLYLLKGLREREAFRALLESKENSRTRRCCSVSGRCLGSFAKARTPRGMWASSKKDGGSKGSWELRVVESAAAETSALFQVGETPAVEATSALLLASCFFAACRRLSSIRKRCTLRESKGDEIFSETTTPAAPSPSPRAVEGAQAEDDRALPELALLCAERLVFGTEDAATRVCAANGRTLTKRARGEGGAGRLDAEPLAGDPGTAAAFQGKNKPESAPSISANSAGYSLPPSPQSDLPSKGSSLETQRPKQPGALLARYFSLRERFTEAMPRTRLQVETTLLGRWNRQMR